MKLLTFYIYAQSKWKEEVYMPLFFSLLEKFIVEIISIFLVAIYNQKYILTSNNK